MQNYSRASAEMATMEKVNVATRATIADLERKWGRKRVYLIGGAIAIVLLLLVVRVISTRKNAPPAPPPRIALVGRVVQKDVPVYLDEIGTCAAYETVQVQAQVSGQIIA
jgi:multidrug efflux pump subunit AcrA (membrane-fusion protein)